MNLPLATILIPTHDATWTLENAVRSATYQTVSEIEILIVGDGVVSETKACIKQLVNTDRRIKFLDLPKSPNRGEQNRDLGVKESASENIFYLADDDLLLNNHLENLLPAINEHHLIQSLNGYVDSKGNLGFYATDLADKSCIEWHLKDPPRNAVSITGTAHKKSTYLALESGWEVAPEGIWPDLHLWRKFFRLPNFTGFTHPEMTTIQFPAPFRKELSNEEFISIYNTWLDLSNSVNASELLAIEVLKSLKKVAVNLSMHSVNLDFEIKRIRDTEYPGLLNQLEHAKQNLLAVTNQLSAIKNSKSWKITRPLRLPSILKSKIKARSQKTRS